MQPSQQLKIQNEAMAQKGIHKELIARELKCMENAIRALLGGAVSGGAK
jgi:hypothetical protein